MKRFAFMVDWKKTFPINRMCRILRVSSRGYRAYEWKGNRLRRIGRLYF